MVIYVENPKIDFPILDLPQEEWVNERTYMARNWNWKSHLGRVVSQEVE